MTAANACKYAVWPYERGTMSTPRPLATLNQAALMLVGRKNTTYSRLLGTAPLLRLTLQQQNYSLSRDYNAMLQSYAAMQTGAMMQTLMMSLMQKYEASTCNDSFIRQPGWLCDISSTYATVAVEVSV